MKLVTAEHSTECSGTGLWELSELRGSLHHAEQGNLNIAMSTVKVRYARMTLPNHS